MANVKLLYGATLEKIVSKNDQCMIIFSKPDMRNSYCLTFSGLIVTTKNFSPKHTVEVASVGILGFRALTEILHKHWNPSEFKQLFIKLKNNNSGEKIELIAGCKNLEIKGIIN